MKRVIFPYAETAEGLIQYPDKIELFANTDLFTVPGSIIADYSGKKSLPEYQGGV